MALKKQAVTTIPTTEKAPKVTPDKSAANKSAPAAAKKAAVPTVKKENKIVRYLKEVRAELRKVVWPTRQTALRLTGIVIGVTAIMSLFLGLVDLIFSKLFGLIIGA
ncbi:MAG: preprotein translocase subunit SecE [Chloroflexi bacterium]|nr:preprotein translocase subunit SecE [Chloroflexota bacterium]